MNNFFRFPHTPHLVWLGSDRPRGDKVLSQNEVRELLADEVIVEEKIDGANLGISFTEDSEIVLQNRGSYLSPPYRGQFTRLTSWLGERAEGLTTILSPETILFGEWCAAKHSLLYDRLPDWFLLFDVYCRGKEQFLSAGQRNAMARVGGLRTVPEIARGKFTPDQLIDLLLNAQSQFRHGTIEG